MWKLVAAGCSVWGVTGCATSFRTVESVAADVKRDEVAAAVRMKSEEVGLEGLAKRKGLKSEATTTGKVTVFPGSMGTAEIVLDDKNVGYVELESASAKPGKALCLFEEWALEKLATVRQGQTVRLVCRFSKIDGAAADRFPVFRNCWVDD